MAVIKWDGTRRENKDMTLLRHLEELRKRSIISAIALAVAAIVCIFFAERIFSFLLDIAPQYNFIYAMPSQLVVQYVQIGIAAGFILALPVILYQIWTFLFPALKSNEKKTIIILLGAGVIFFVCGIFFAYYIMIPSMLNFFFSANINDRVSPTITIESYTNFLITTFLIFGLVFELPTLLSAFTHFGLVKSKWLIRGQKYAILIIFILAAIITPPDVVSQIMVGVPLLILYELSVGICYLIEKIKAKRREV